MHPPINSPDRPAFIIWTMQRTGGTNFARWLDGFTGKPLALHEPFMETRILGHASRGWRLNQNVSMLEDALCAALHQRPSLKHCIDTAPVQVSLSLAKVAATLGYVNIFLYRSVALDRMLSAHFARATGIWFPTLIEGEPPENLEQALQVTPKKQPTRIRRHPLKIPVEAMLEQERCLVRLLQFLWKSLRNSPARSRTIAVSYESLYCSGQFQTPPRALAQILGLLRVDASEKACRDSLERLKGQGEQGTRSLYSQLPGYEELARSCVLLPTFNPSEH